MGSKLVGTGNFKAFNLIKGVQNLLQFPQKNDTKPVWYGLYENLPFGRNRNKQQNLAHFDNNDSCTFDTFEVETTQLFEPSFLEITQLFSVDVVL